MVMPFWLPIGIIRIMNCLNPITAYVLGKMACKRDGVISPRLSFSPNEAMSWLVSQGQDASMLDTIAMSVPCGKCMACLIRKRKEMVTRLAKEQTMHPVSCFLTLTYDDEHLPRLNSADTDGFSYPTLVKKDVQDFMKRLRRSLEYSGDVPRGTIRYFAVGEYGGKTLRPHYHVILFGWRPSDARPFKNLGGHVASVSERVKSLWSFGFHLVEDATNGSLRYCARYVTKKLTNPGHKPAPVCVDEFVLCSKGSPKSVPGGIGAPWFDKYGADACKNGVVIVDTGLHMTKNRVPSYFWDRLRKTDLGLWLQLRQKRMEYAIEHAENVSPDSLQNLKNMVNCELQKIKQASEREIF